MADHNYILERIVPNDSYRWIIFCTKCGHVAFYGNATEASISKMQYDLPRDCATKDHAEAVCQEAERRGKGK